VKGERDSTNSALYYIFNSLRFDPLIRRKRSAFIAEGQRVESWAPRFSPLDLLMIVTACNAPALIDLSDA